MTHLKSIGISFVLAAFIVTGIVMLLSESDPKDNQPLNTSDQSTSAAVASPDDIVTTRPNDTSDDKVDDQNDEDLTTETPEGSSTAPEELVLPSNQTNDDAIPVTTNHFAISESSDGSLNITLYAILNRPEQYSEYEQQLSDYKQEALDYLEQNGYNAGTINISYTPSEAQDL